ncbi:MAG TPA: HAD hydrolase family protein, partial [Vicinamibacterales bacterium]|nr:HAD hydrolase family protein [Vicinamibacterales bacterium]
KGSTLARLVASRGWTRDEVMAVGDNLNDVDMLDFAGTAVVMGNATDALKARGYQVTGSNDEGGLATAVRNHLRQR